MNDCRDAWAQLMRAAAEQQAGRLKPPVTAQGKPTPHDFAGMLPVLVLSSTVKSSFCPQGMHEDCSHPC